MQKTDHLSKYASSVVYLLLLTAIIFLTLANATLLPHWGSCTAACSDARMSVSIRLCLHFGSLSCNMLQDMSEIISYMSSGLWSDRRDGLYALQQYLDNQIPMS